MSHNSYFTFFFFFLALLPITPAPTVLPEPDPASIQPFLPTPSPSGTIPAFPEQSDVAGCPLDLPDNLFHGIKSACVVGKRKSDGDRTDQLHRSRCCPVLAAWLYSAYSATALGRTGRVSGTGSYDLPLLPDDSETCVGSLEKALNNRGIELVKPNETCGRRLLLLWDKVARVELSGSVLGVGNGSLVGDENVERLETDCSSTNGNSGLGRCSTCLNSLYLLNGNKDGNKSEPEDRTRKMHNRDCELMGLTWLLAKNRSAYIHTVSSVLRAIMMSTDGSDPLSCSLGSDGMPLAVDARSISSSPTLQLPSSFPILFISLCLFSMSLIVSTTGL